MSQNRPCVWDHPRMCGEHITGNADDAVKAGSSPHVRGARLHSAALHVYRGIIPACAGSTTAEAPNTLEARDHPRMCGEHDVCNSGLAVNQGSSPHVRGALVRLLTVVSKVGIIPACAGSTQALRRGCFWLRDHPRMCGEHTTRYLPPVTRAGSSPHVRGALHGVPV